MHLTSPEQHVVSGNPAGAVFLSSSCAREKLLLYVIDPLLLMTP
jgi:hypothetical protein